MNQEAFLSDLKATLASIVQEQKTMAQQITDLSKQVTSLTTQMTGVEHVLSNAVGQVHGVAMKVDHLGETFGGAEKSITEAGKRSGLLGMQVNGIRMDVGTLKKELGTLSGKMEDLGGRASRIETTLDSSLGAIRTDLLKAVGEKRTDLETQTSLDSRLSSVESKIRSLLVRV